MIQAGSKPVMLEDVAADFQIENFQNLAPNLEALRDGRKPEMQRCWIERTKKASKDADLGAILLWLTAFPRRPFYGEVGAASTEQAAIVKDRISVLLEYNPWLLEHLELVQSEIRSIKTRGDGRPLATIKIKSSDIASAHGGTPDILVINELSHITKWEFVENMLDNADGVPDGMVIIATNAGFKGTKAEVLRDMAIESGNWMVNIVNRPAPWHSLKALEDAKRRNRGGRYERLWLGHWTSGAGDALDEEDIERCFVLKGSSDWEKDWEYVAGMDLGISRDRSAVCVLGIHREKRVIKTAWFKSWKPPGKGRGTKTSEQWLLMKVQEWVMKLWKDYKLQAVIFDTTEGELMAQQLRWKQVHMIGMNFRNNRNLVDIATSLIGAVEDGVLKCYDDRDGTLRRDFGKFSIAERSYGYRLEATRDEHGHADVGTALAIALPHCLKMLGGTPGALSPDEPLVFDQGLLPGEEPDESFRDLFDYMDDVRQDHDEDEDEEYDQFFDIYR